MDANFNKTTQANASYYFERQFVRPYMMIKGVPTYDNGMAMQADDTGYVINLHKYYYLNHQLAFSVEVFAERDNPENYIHSGAAVWYYETSELLAKGQFDGGNLAGKYIEYNKDGSISNEMLFVGGEVFDVETNVYQPLIGKWVHTYYDDDGDKKDLVNIFNADGTMQIYTIDYWKSYNSTEWEVWKTGDPSTFYWKYQQNPNGQDTMGIYYENGELLGKEIAEVNGNSFYSKITEHKSPSIVGKEYNFKRQ